MMWSVALIYVGWRHGLWDEAYLSDGSQVIMIQKLSPYSYALYVHNAYFANLFQWVVVPLGTELLIRKSIGIDEVSA